MSWNKTSIASTASLNQIAQTFSLKRNVAGSHHLRAKTDSEGHTVIYQKHFSTTKFLAILGSADAKATIRKQRQLANHLLSEKVGNEYGSGTVESARDAQEKAVRAEQSLHIIAILAFCPKAGSDRGGRTFVPAQER